MRNKTPKRAALDRQTEKVAKAYREEFIWCQRCKICRATDIHEIASAAARAQARGERCCLLALCRECHEALHEDRVIAKELALKLVVDPEHFNRSRVLELMGYADTHITMDDIADHLEVTW
jgi:hypothetical protein